MNTQHIDCNGGSNGYTIANATGGTSPYTYVWNDPASQTNAWALYLSSGTYTVTATDAVGCSDQAIATINEPPPWDINISTTDETCFGGCDGTAFIADSCGGVWGQPEYYWNDPAAQITQYATGLCPGTYTVLVGDTFYNIIPIINVTDTVVCFNSASTTINGPASPVTTNLIIGNDVSCYGLCDGNANVTASGGTSPYTYLWNSGGTGTSVSGLCPGTITVTVNDANNCDSTISDYINEPAPITTTVTSTELPCDGIQMGSAKVEASDGIIPYTYLWSDGQTTATASGLEEGFYTVTVTDNNYCTASNSATIIKEICAVEIEIPDTYSPNGDGINDVWNVTNLSFYSDCTVNVYNRWGEQVFTSTGYGVPWNGKSKGLDMPAAVYYYVIVIPQTNETHAGAVTIVR